MKKSTKILTFLLSACMLFGMCTALLASAEEASAAGGANKLDVTGHSYNLADDCTTGVKGKQYLVSSTGDTKYFGMENSVKSAHISASHVQEPGRDNTYVRIHSTPGILDSNPTNPFREATVRWRGHTTYSAEYDLKEHKYLTLDFDFGADRWAYTYTLDGETAYKTAASDEEFEAFINTLTSDKAKAEACAKEAIDSKQLAFPNTATPLNFNFMFLSSNSQTPDATLVQNSASTSWRTLSKTAFSVVKKDDVWYLQGKSSEGATVTYELKNEVAKFDHITMVFKVLDGGLTVQPHAYINGEYMMQLPDWEMNGSVKNCNVFYQMALAFYKNVGEGNISGKMYDQYSLALDNVALNYYDSFDADVTGGLGEFMSSENYKDDEAIMNCNDVVYNGDYYLPGTSLLAAITHADNTQTMCYTRNSVHKSLRNGDFVELYPGTSVKSLNPDPEIDVITFTATTEAGKEAPEVTLALEAQEYFKLQHTQRQIKKQVDGKEEIFTVDKYTVLNAKDYKGDVTVRWEFGESYGNAETGKVQKLMPGQKLVNNLKIAYEPKTTEDGVLKIGVVNAWYWDVDGNGEINTDVDKLLSEEFANALTRAEINEKYIDKGIDEIVMIPKVEYVPVQFTIKTGEGDAAELYAPDYEFDKFSNISKLASAIAKLEKGATYNVTLYSNLELAEEQTILVPANVTLNFDLNGQKISQSASSASSVFTLSSGVNFNLYSDKAGAEVYQTGKGTALITANNIDKTTINLSKITEADANGDNLTMYGSSIVYLKGAEAKADAVKTNIINLNGGNYYGTEASNGALFPIADADMKFNIKNADIVTQKGEAVFTVISGYVASADISVEKTNMFAGKVENGNYAVNNFIKDWNTDTKLYIKDSVVLGFKNNNNVTLGSGNKFNATLDSTIGCESGTFMAFSNNGKYVMESVVIEVPGEEEAITQTFEITLITFTAETVEACMKPVKWLAPDGAIYKTTYWVVGSTVVEDLLESTAGFEKIELNNNWFDVEFDGWMNTTEGAEKNSFTILDKENTFAPNPKYIANMNTVKVGVSVYDYLAYNVYVPTPSLENYEMSFVGFFDKDGNKIELNVYSNVTLDGVEGWNRLIGLFENGDFTAKTITIKYEVNGQVLAASVTIDVFNYAYRVDSEFGCGTEESKLVYAMMQYKRSIFKATNTDAELDSWFEGEWAKYMIFHDEDCACQKAVDYTAPTATADDSAISALVAKYSFTLNVDENDNISYAFSLFLNEKATVKINGETITGVKNGDYTEYTLTGLELADLAEEIEIVIGTASGKYSLANYVKANETDFAKALYVLATNAE